MRNQNQKHQPRKFQRNNPSEEKTSWGGVAEWYDEYLQDSDTYQAQVIAPNLMRVLDAKNITDDMRVLELGCGQGYFIGQILDIAKPHIEGVDVAPELLAIAKKNIGADVSFTETDASDLSHVKDKSIDKIYSVLAIQNMSDLDKVFGEVKRVIKDKGQFVAVLNHPAFRVPKQSDWYFSPDRKTQGRVTYTYMTDQKFSIDMHPGLHAAGQKKEETLSFHHPLQYYSKLLSKHGFCITKIEEWLSHKSSQEGPRKRAEDQARKEIPLFLTLEIRPFLA